MRDGWFHTGDAAVVHPDGYVEIRDRLKDVIISGGENISSVEVEGVLLRHPAVQEVAVVGLPHESGARRRTRSGVRRRQRKGGGGGGGGIVPKGRSGRALYSGGGGWCRGSHSLGRYAGHRPPPMFASSPGLTIEVISRYDEKGPAWYWNTIRLGEHTGTHFDAPIHWITGKDLPENACDTLPARRLVGPACVIDVTREVEADPDFLLTPARIEAWEREHGRIPRGPWVLLRTGWSKRRDAASFLNVGPDGPHSPGFDKTASQLLATSATCSASASRRSAPMRARPAGSIRRSRTTGSCTAPASSASRACAIWIACRRRAQSSSPRR